MPIFSNFRRSKLDDHKSAKGSSNSARPADAPKPGDLSKTFQNGDHLNQCAGCSNVEILIRRQLEQRKNGAKSFSSGTLHNSFRELDSCAQNCKICRVFRQALILTKVTFDGVKQLRNTSGEVLVRWRETTDADGTSRVFLNVELKGHPECAGIVDLSSRNDVVHLALGSEGLNTAVIQQAKQWLDTCRHHHVGECDNLRWSSENPKILIELLSPTSFRLRENQRGDYVALSYCWGLDISSEAEKKQVIKAKTVMDNVDQRYHALPSSELPNTIRDALQIIHAMGVRYAWIDSLCIVQDKKIPGTEVPEGVGSMHLIYSNALFTLCASATTKATATLLDKREAWTWGTEPCRLGGQWLTTPDMSLHELRLKSPLAGRAWTLQEERLSPRILYVSSDRWHWSCAKGHELELKPTYPGRVSALRRPMYAALDHKIAMPLAQEFLLACWSGKSDQLPGYWADIVKSYTARSMTVMTDRLTALSGVAAKYLSASQGDEYLAGLWANHLAAGLAWRVLQPVQRDVDDEASPWPSWSWAVTPAPTALETFAAGQRSSFFQLTAVRRGQRADFARTAEDAIKSGQEVKEIRVTGRTRAFWKHSSVRVAWSTVSTLKDGHEVFVFGAHQERDMHALHVKTGRVLVYEDRGKEVIGQLDFQRLVEKMDASLTNLKALEVGVSTMLLLQNGWNGTWRRVGVAWDVRDNYFALAQTETLTLR